MSSVSRDGLDSPSSSTRAAIRRLSDSHPQQSSHKGEPVVCILRDSHLPLSLFVFCLANSVSRATLSWLGSAFHIISCNLYKVYFFSNNMHICMYSHSKAWRMNVELSLIRGVVPVGRFAMITAGSGRLIPRECSLNQAHLQPAPGNCGQIFFFYRELTPALM